MCIFMWTLVYISVSIESLWLYLFILKYKVFESETNQVGKNFSLLALDLELG